jgi:hypothetical protein
MDIIAILLGFIIGVVAVGLAIELGMKKTDSKQPASRPTHKWSLEGITNPRIIAEHLGDISIPKNAKLVVNQYKDRNMFLDAQVKKHSGIRGNYILGDDRALILAGPIQENELGIWTVEKTMIDKLDRYFQDSWQKASVMDPEEEKN